ncbi:MAG: tetratricopeptide 4 [Gemmatimonadetes bacterium]|jgi:hypothetical protein|nr:tetratricopeptide 4 [Gemmatimonadota bacterium]
MRLRIGVFVTALVPLLSGCATLRATIDGWSGGHGGLTRSQREVREALAGQDYAVALAAREDDALLRSLMTGATTFYAAQYARSAALLDTAALLSDERLTASVSKNALSLMTNDMARPYQVRRTERLFVPYYGMLAYARLGQWEDAAVEARRMVALLAAFRSDRDDAERALHASMHYLAGAVFEHAGEAADARVAYRNAHALVDAYPEQGVPATAEEGDVLVVIERGFVAHRATETIHIALGHDDREGLRGSDESRRRVVDRIVQRLAPPAAATSAVPDFRQRDVVAAPAGSAAAGPRAAETHVVATREDGDDDVDRPRRISLAFPVLHRSARPWAGPPRLRRDSAGVVPAESLVQLSASVDDASEADERRERAGVIAREMARAAAKYSVRKAIEDRKGEVAGRIAEIGASMLERADVRSWHVLPQEIVVMRLRLPPGQHALVVEVGEGANARQVDLGSVRVKRGAVSLAAARFWREPAYSSHTRCVPHGMSCPY